MKKKMKLIQEGKRGKDIVLTIDINLQKEVERILEEEIRYTKTEPNTKNTANNIIKILKLNFFIRFFTVASNNNLLPILYTF